MTTENYLVFDIETVTIPYDEEHFSDSQREYLIRGAKSDEERERKLAEMGLTPLTARVACIGMQLMQVSDEGDFSTVNRVAYSLDDTMGDDEKERVETLSTGDTCYLSSERKLLENFWKLISKVKPHLISFNGRNFDAPFLMLRSAVLGIRPSRNLMSGTKFNYPLHTDLIDELTFFSSSSYGATKRFNFDFYTRAFGLVSPKSEGIDGSKVSEFFAEGKILEITEYCLRDVTATWQMYEIWMKYLRF